MVPQRLCAMRSAGIQKCRPPLLCELLTLLCSMTSPPSWILRRPTALVSADHHCKKQPVFFIGDGLVGMNRYLIPARGQSARFLCFRALLTSLAPTDSSPLGLIALPLLALFGDPGRQVGAAVRGVP